MSVKNALMKSWIQLRDGHGKETAVNPKPVLQPFPTCQTKYHATKSSGTRTPDQIRYVVLHTTESETAEGTAQYFASDKAMGSAHVVVSDDICYRTLDDNVIPWAAPPLNTSGYHIEIVGFAHWSGTEWQHHYKRVLNAAWRASIRCHRFGIPVEFLSAVQLRANPDRRGITTHNEVSIAWGKSDHSDPGPNFPMPFFLEACNEYVQRLKRDARA